ncbi:MAG: CbiX/SirB N-terminal domain-containing protein [Ignavibacteriae bacterium]|nr:CbiX/SirB N-terminal domain-containing protein [Ignavibacteriota bacterium]
MNKFNITYFLTFLIISVFFLEIKISASDKQQSKKIGVLLVNHGSHSATWRNALIDLEKSVKPELLQNKSISKVTTAFMEYTEPSIATRLKEFDEVGFTDIILIPIFLTVSSHSFDDIPTIIGKKNDKHSLELLKIEKIERYIPKAKIHITPLLDFRDILEKNVLKRVGVLTKKSDSEGLVLIAYGDKTYNKEWSELLEKVGNTIKENFGIDKFSYGWCGHVANYNPDSTTIAINQVLNKKEKALVVPVLVAHDEMFQIKIIGDGIKKIKNSNERVIYKPDSILPDENIEKWILDISNEFIKKINLSI